MPDPTPRDPLAKRRAARLPRVWRLVALGLAVWLLRFTTERPERAAGGATISIEQAHRYFAEAQTIGPRDPGRGWQAVLDATGKTLGHVLTTSPQTDELVGYSGPNNLLIALGPDGRVVGIDLLGSGDTPAHVTEVQRNTSIWRAWLGWNPATEPAPRIEAVAGSTLTSLGIAEAVERRLAGRGVSLRFPEPVVLEEVRETFPESASLDAVAEPVNGLRIRDGSGRLLGYAIRSSPQAETVRGHGGPTEALALIDRDGETVRAVRLRRSYDSDDYVARVREDGPFLKSLASRKVADWARLDFKQAGIEGVSGATETSYAAAEGLHRRFAAEVQHRPQSRTGRWGLAGRWKDGVLLVVILGSLFMAFGGGRGRKSVRRVWQVLLVGVFGLGLGDLLSVSWLAGWSRHGVAWETAPGLVLLAALALLVPWATERAWYCHHLCPHGVVQEWLTRFRRCRIAVPVRVNRWLVWGGPGLLALAFLAVLAGLDVDLAWIEPFDAWTFTAAAWVSAIVAGIGLGASLFVPMAYCRFGCPTGALLAFLRHGGRGDRLGTRDAVAALLPLTGAGLVFARTPPTSTRSAADDSGRGGLPGGDVQVFAGRAFGTTWTVKLRQPVADPGALETALVGELERIEASLSHWRTNSATSQFNAASTTQALEMPAELVGLVARCREISRATDGAFDITVAPLVQAWGFGPGASPPAPPEPATLEALRARVGWQRLGIDTNAMTLRKDHPGLQIDLGAILQGYAADRLAERLVVAGSTNHLIEVGGELLARGRWEVAIEEPGGAGRVLRRVTLQDAALATSGTYRTRRSDGGRARSHLMDPRTGLPVDHGVVLASVVHPSCALADAWATAMLVLGGTKAEDFARTQGIEVLTVEGLRQPWQVGTTQGFPAVTPVE